MTKRTQPKPYLLIRFISHCEGWAVEEYDTPEEALQNADLSSGDIIAKRLTVKIAVEDGARSWL